MFARAHVHGNSPVHIAKIMPKMTDEQVEQAGAELDAAERNSDEEKGSPGPSTRPGSDSALAEARLDEKAGNDVGPGMPKAG